MQAITGSSPAIRQQLGEGAGSVGVVGGVEDHRRISRDELGAPGDRPASARAAVSRIRVRLARDLAGGSTGEHQVLRLEALCAGADRDRTGVPFLDEPARRRAPPDPAPVPRSVPVWSRSTASFSAAISSSVSPSHSVWSSPTEVSTVTREGITLVASSRPPSPASITATSTPGRGEGDERGRGRELELGHRPPLLEPRGSTVSAASAVRSTAAANASCADLLAADQIRSRQERTWGETQAPVRDPVRLEQRRGHQRHRGLAVGADDVDRGEAVLGHAEQRAEPAHPLEAELPADRLERVRGSASRVYRRAPRARPCRRSSLARSSSTTSAGALATNPSLASLPSPRLTSARSSSRRSSIRFSTASASTPSEASSSTPRRPSPSARPRRRRTRPARGGRPARAAARRCVPASVAPAATPARSRQRRSAPGQGDRAGDLLLGAGSISDSSASGNGLTTSWPLAVG